MKFRHILTGTFFTISLLAAAAFTSFAAVSKGRFETVDATAITGWAYNSDKSDDALNVQIVITNKNTGEEVFESVVSAGEYRQNLYDQYMGNGCHGFTINIDWTNYPQGVYLVEGTVGSRKFSNTRTYTNGSSDTAESSQTASGDLKLVPLGVFKTTATVPARAALRLGTPYQHRSHGGFRPHHRCGPQSHPLRLPDYDQRSYLHSRGQRRRCERETHRYIFRYPR